MSNPNAERISRSRRRELVAEPRKNTAGTFSIPRRSLKTLISRSKKLVALTENARKSSQRRAKQRLGSFATSVRLRTRGRSNEKWVRP